MKLMHFGDEGDQVFRAIELKNSRKLEKYNLKEIFLKNLQSHLVYEN
jgi:hypothetical protein